MYLVMIQLRMKNRVSHLFIIKIHLCDFLLLFIPQLDSLKLIVKFEKDYKFEIERDGLVTIKTVSAASLAVHSLWVTFLQLDNCIETIRKTGLDL